VGFGDRAPETLDPDRSRPAANPGSGPGCARCPTRVVAPAGPCLRFAESCLDAFDDTAFYSQRRAGETGRPEIEVDPFSASDELTVVHEGPSATVEAVLVVHGPMEAAVGYRISSDAGAVAISGDTVVGTAARSPWPTTSTSSTSRETDVGVTGQPGFE